METVLQKHFTETSENSSEKDVREKLVKKFGEKYSTEPMVEVGGYYFYIDAIGHGDDLFKAYFLDEGSEEKRKNYLEQSTENFKVIAQIFRRYEIKQEDFRGVGQWGSVQCFTFCHGAEEDKFGNKKYPDSKILFHRSFSKGDKAPYCFEGVKDIESFGFKVIDNGISKRILDVPKEKMVDDKSIGDVFIDNIQKRLEWWQSEYGVKDRDGWVKKTDSLGLWLKNKIDDGLVDTESWIKLVLGEMDLVKESKEDLPPAREEPWKKNETIDTLRRSVKDVVDYIQVREMFKYDASSMDIALKIEPRNVWKQLEDTVVNGQEISVLYPDGLASLPAIYLLVQWAATYFSGDEDMAKKDMQEYWSKIKVVKKEDLLVDRTSGNLLLVTGTSYDWDLESDEVDTPDIKEIREKLNVKLAVADIASGKLR